MEESRGKPMPSFFESYKHNRWLAYAQGRKRLEGRNGIFTIFLRTKINRLALEFPEFPTRYKRLYPQGAAQTDSHDVKRSMGTV